MRDKREITSGGGSSSGCICGAVSGGTVALGLVLTDKKETTRLTKELHIWFKEKYGVTCCKIIRQNHKGVWPHFFVGFAAGLEAGSLLAKGRCLHPDQYHVSAGKGGFLRALRHAGFSLLMPPETTENVQRQKHFRVSISIRIP